jgi:hypothetical protein
VKQSLLPLSTEELIETIEKNQTTTMFMFPGEYGEHYLRDLSGDELFRFIEAVNKYPNNYLSDFFADVERTKAALADTFVISLLTIFEEFVFNQRKVNRNLAK